MKEKGFTLVELIVAIALLGIIVAIAVPTYNHVTESTKQKAFENKAEQIELAAEKWAEELNLSNNKVITVNRLIEDGYLQADEFKGDTALVENPINNENMICYTIEISLENGQSTAKLNSENSDCSLKDEEDKERSIQVSAFKITNNKIINNNNFKLDVNELNTIEWTNTDILLVVEMKDNEVFDKIFWSENGVNTTTSLEGKQLLKSSEIKKNQTINVENYGNAIVVSTSVLLKANYEISVYTKDNGTKNTSVKVQIDKEAPRIDAKASTEMVTTATRETHLTGTDGEGSGLESFIVTEKGKNEFETFAAGNGSIKIGLKPAQEGNEIVYEIYGLDKVGNRSKTAIELIVKNVDNQGANVIELVGTPDNDTFTKKITLTGSARDDISGLVGYQFTTTDKVPSEWIDIELTNDEVTYNKENITENGLYYFWVKDSLNNTSKAKYEVKNIDLIAGDIIKITPSTTNYTKTLTLTGTATDNLSGIVKYQLTTSSTEPSSGWTTTDATKTITTTLNITKNGTYYLWVIDAVGNVNKKSYVINNIDTTAPSVSLKPSTTSYTKSLTLTGTARDSQSNIVKYQITTSSAQPSSGWTTGNSKSITATKSITSNGKYYFWAQDSAGNISKTSYNITNIDREPPVYSYGGSVSISGSNGVISTAYFTDKSPVTVYYYASTSSYQPSSSSIRSTSRSFYASSCETYYYAYAKAVDQAGNETIRYLGAARSGRCCSEGTYTYDYCSSRGYKVYSRYNGCLGYTERYTDYNRYCWSDESCGSWGSCESNNRKYRTCYSYYGGSRDSYEDSKRCVYNSGGSSSGSSGGSSGGSSLPVRYEANRICSSKSSCASNGYYGGGECDVITTSNSVCGASYKGKYLCYCCSTKDYLGNSISWNGRGSCVSN